MKRTHYYILADWKLYHPEAFKISEHNHHVEVDFKNRVHLIPIKRHRDSPAVVELLLDLIGVGFKLMLSHKSFPQYTISKTDHEMIRDFVRASQNEKLHSRI